MDVVRNMDSETEATTLSAGVLVEKAKKLEAQGLEKNKIALACVSNLGQLLDEVYSSRSPKQIDYDNRADLVRIFNVIVEEVFGNHDGSPIVEGFGSFVMGMFSADSDLDLSINFRDNEGEIPRLKKLKTLRKLSKKLYSIQSGGHVTGIQRIMTARVPVVKVIDVGTRIECDLSVENRDGIEKSLIIRAISTIDERFQKLSFLIKAWAKAHDINSSKEQTLNSLSLVLLVAFHLQTRDPSILPPFSALFKDRNDPTAVMKMVKNYLNYGKSNTESLAELFVTLLVKLASVEELWQKGLCVSSCEGSWISKAGVSGFRTMSVEDFTDQSQNVSRAVGKAGFEKIHGCIQISLHYLKALSDGQMRGSKLKELLFGTDTMSDNVATNLVKPTTEISVLSNPNEIKKTWLTETLGAESQSKTQLVHQETHQTKKRCKEDLDKSKGTKRSVPSNPNGIKKTKLTETLGAENQSKTQLVHQETHQTKKRLCTEDLDKSKGTKQGKETQLLDRRGAVQFMEGGKKQLPEKAVKTLPTSGWKGNHPVDGWRESTTFGENSGHLNTHFTPQFPYHIPFSHSLDSLRCQNPVFFPSISAPNLTNLQVLCNLIQLQPHVPLLNSLGLDVSHFLNSPAPMPHIGPVNKQHAQHQPHTVPRRPGE